MTSEVLIILQIYLRHALQLCKAEICVCEYFQGELQRNEKD